MWRPGIHLNRLPLFQRNRGFGLLANIFDYKQRRYWINIVSISYNHLLANIFNCDSDNDSTTGLKFRNCPRTVGKIEMRAELSILISMKVTILPLFVTVGYRNVRFPTIIGYHILHLNLWI